MVKIAVCIQTVSTFNFREEYNVANAAFCIIRGGVQAMDVSTVEHQNGQRTFMTLLQSWGLVADLDIESERFRSIGETRFILGSIKAVLQRRLYQGKVHFLPEEENTPAAANGGATSAAEVKNSEKSESSSKDLKDEEERTTTEEEHQELVAPPTNLLPPLSEPVPSSWTTIEGNFVGFTTIMCSFFGHGFLANGDMKLGSGLIELDYCMEDMSRWGMMALMLSGETGNFRRRSDMNIVKTKAYRVEPSPSTPGIITIDGEVIDYAPHQLQIHPGLGRLMTRRRVH